MLFNAGDAVLVLFACLLDPFPTTSFANGEAGNRRPYYLGLLFATTIADWNGLRVLVYRHSLVKLSIVAK